MAMKVMSLEAVEQNDHTASGMVDHAPPELEEDGGSEAGSSDMGKYIVIQTETSTVTGIVMEMQKLAMEAMCNLGNSDMMGQHAGIDLVNHASGAVHAEAACMDLVVWIPLPQPSLSIYGQKVLDTYF